MTVPEPPKGLRRKVRFYKIVNGPDSGAFWLGVILTLFGFWLLLPGETFTTESWARMAQIASETGWGVAMMLGGALLLGGVRSGERKMVYPGLWLAAACYLAIATSFAAVNWHSTAVATYSVLALRALLLRKNYR